jgi:NADH dehydrogenase
MRAKRREGDGGRGGNGAGDGAAGLAPHVVIIGGGFGGLQAAKRLGGKPVRVTIVDRQNYHLFQPLLYQVALAGLSPADIAVPIRAIVGKHRNVDVLLAEVTGFDLTAREVRLADGRSLAYDFLVVAAGATTNYYGHPEWARDAPGLKDLDDAIDVRRRVLLALEQAESANDPEERKRLMTFAVIGGGPTGVELAGAIADLSRDILGRDFRHLDPKQVRVVLLEVADRILTPFTPKLSERAAEQLADLGVEIRTKVKVNRVDEHGVWVDDAFIPAATVIWGAGVSPSPLGRLLGAPLDRAGRVVVGQDCALAAHPEVFVVGDLAAFVPEGEQRPLPGLSPVAIQQGRLAARNILHTIAGSPRERFVYFDKGFMATIGRARAVAQLRNLRFSGFVAWLAWVFVHLWYVVGFRNRISVFLNWIWSYVMTKHGTRLITGVKPRPTPPPPAGIAPAAGAAPPPPGPLPTTAAARGPGGPS